ncbi:MAG: hypothetical protein QM811_11595 [Pirellulales bacterium]
MSNRAQNTLIFAVLATAIVAYFVSYSVHRSTIVPPPYGVDRATFEAAQGSPHALESFDHHGQRYLRWIGEPAPTIFWGSGDRVYVFDDADRLVDWSADEGDDPGFTARWNGFPNRLAIP